MTKNQVGSSPYDASGNILALPPGYTFTYDAENRIASETNSGGLSASYYYDGTGKRVEKVLSNGQAVVYAYDAFGQLAAEYSPATTWSKDYVPLNGRPAVVENATANPCTTCYLGYDYLGTVRLVTDASANVMARHDYLPFGDEIPGGVAGRNSQFGPYTDSVDEKFTGQVRDTETLNDFFNARYYTAPLMRFLSSDPGNAGADPTDPQTWNGYAYVRNSPLALVDPSGMDPITDIPTFTATGICGLSCFSIGSTYSSFSFGDSLNPSRFELLGNDPASGYSANFSITRTEKSPAQPVSTPPTQQPWPASSGTPAPKPLSCQINSRAANIPGGQFLHSIGINHEWITTSTGISVGMGTARGVPQSDYPGVQTQVVNHTGQVPTSSVIFDNVDAAALNTYIKAGTPTGPWIPGMNDCNTWANGAINNSTPHNITIGIYGVPITIGTNVVVYSDGSIHAPGGN